MKKLTFVAVMAATLAAMSGSAAAETVGAGFTVSATLAAKCESTTTGTPDVNFGEYTAFGGPATTAPTATLTFRCTRNLAITDASLSATSGTLKGVDYSLVIDSHTPSAGTGTAPDTHAYVVKGTMATGQAGDTSDTTVQQARTLTITF